MRNIVLGLLILLTGFLNAEDLYKYKTIQEVNYLIRQTNYYDEKNVIPKDTVIYSNGEGKFSLDSYWKINTSNTFVFSYMNSEYFTEDIEKLIPADTVDLFPSNIISNSENDNIKQWVDVKLYESMLKKDREIIRTNFPIYLDEYFVVSFEEGGWVPKWYEIIDVSRYSMGISNAFLQFYSKVSLPVINIIKTNNEYYVTVGAYFDKQYYSNLVETTYATYGLKGEKCYYNYPDWSLVISKKQFELILVIDGDYLDIYLENKQMHLCSMVLVTKESLRQFDHFLETNTCDFSVISIPKRGACSTNLLGKTSVKSETEKAVFLNSLMILTDNLRLRSAEETSSDILATLEKDTIVTVLSLGKEDTIDGIQSNWVKVQLEDGTIGWCFGGYLSTTPIEVPSSYKSNQAKGSNQNKDSTTNTFAGLSPTTLIVASGLVILLLGAGVFFFLKRKK